MLTRKFKKELNKATTAAEFAKLIFEILPVIVATAEEDKKIALGAIDLIIKTIDKKLAPQVEAYDAVQFEEFYENMFWNIFRKPYQHLHSLQNYLNSGQAQTTKLLDIMRGKTIEQVGKDLSDASYENILKQHKKLNEGYIYDTTLPFPGKEEIIKRIEEMKIAFIKGRRADKDIQYLKMLGAIYKPENMVIAADDLLVYFQEKYKGKLTLLKPNDLLVEFTEERLAIDSVKSSDSDITAWEKLFKLFDEMHGELILDSVNMDDEEMIHDAYFLLSDIPGYQIKLLEKVKAVDPEKADRLLASARKRSASTFGFAVIPGLGILVDMFDI